MLTSGEPITPPVTIAFSPPSELPVECEILPVDAGVVVSFGSVLVTSNASFTDMTITAQPGSTSTVRVRARHGFGCRHAAGCLSRHHRCAQLRCRRGAEEVFSDATVTMRDCAVGEIHPKGVARCKRCPTGSFTLTAGEELVECSTCPLGAVCAGGSHVVAVLGTWRFSPHHLSFFDCPVPDACLGFDSTSSSSTTTPRTLTTSDESDDAAMRAAPEGCGVGCVWCRLGWHGCRGVVVRTAVDGSWCGQVPRPALQCLRARVRQIGRHTMLGMSRHGVVDPHRRRRLRSDPRCDLLSGSSDNQGCRRSVASIFRDEGASRAHMHHTPSL